MKVLVACEYSGRVRDAFIARGHDATSLDLLPTDALGPHVVADVVEYVAALDDLALDLIIAHPPCTALTVAGNSTYGKGMAKHHMRLEQAQWTQDLWHLCKRKARRVCFENPVGVLSSMTDIPKPFFVQPWQFGHLEQKKTGLHLHNLPQLRPTKVVYDEMILLPRNVRERLHYLPPSQDRWKIRSTTFQGIANAMADQWSIT
jgi:site-specific DNA-cytosine methylase